MYFSVGNTTGGTPSWWLYGENREKVAWAGETFSSMSNAHLAAAAFKAGAATARFEVYADAGGHWRWRALRSSDNVAASGESFSSKDAATRAAANVQAHAGGATGL